jgi:hypothetical protein
MLVDTAGAAAGGGDWWWLMSVAIEYRACPELILEFFEKER